MQPFTLKTHKLSLRLRSYTAGSSVSLRKSGASPPVSPELP